MHYNILGPLQVRSVDGEPIKIVGARQRSLLSLLALTPGRPVSVDELLTGQYEEAPPAEARNAIQAQISRLRRSLPPGTIGFEAQHYQLIAEPDDVDACRFERLANDGRERLRAGDAAAAARLLRGALDLWRGPALADVAGADAVIARLEEARLAAAEDLVEAELAAPSGTSVADLRALVEEHPLRERLRGLLMRALAAAGSPADALTEFERARNVLAEELGADPSPDLRAIHLEILRGDQPTPRPAPIQATSFVGRQDELTALAEAAGSRLLTVIGPGGVGKTRLAIEAAGRATGPVAFVDLAAVFDDRQVVPAALAALGRRDPMGGADGTDAARRLAEALVTEDLTLLLDNCEHVRAGVTELCRAIVLRCPGIRMITTSRVALGLTEETLVPLGGLAVDPAVVTAPSAATGNRPRLDPAVRLFIDRATAVRRDLVADEDTLPLVAGICAAVDGLPLAIELAAARTRQFSIPELSRRLVDHGRLRLLRGDPTAAERHQTLTAVVRWSWDLLSAEQQQLARRFAVFAGGAGLDAVESVCGTDDADLLLADLVDHSLVEVADGRYRMLETVRSFCAEQLAMQGDEECRTRHDHALYYWRLVESADPHLRRSEQLDWLNTLAVEDANLTTALGWAVDHDPSIAMRLVCSSAAYWWLSGRNGRAGDFAHRLITMHPVDAAKGNDGLDEAYVSCVVHAVPRASGEHWQRAVAIMAGRDRPLEHPFGAALWGMTVGPRDDDLESAGRLLGTDPWNLALGRLSRVLMGMLGGRPEREEPEMLAALEDFRRLGDRWGTAQALDWLGQLASWRGSWPQAHRLWSEALDLQRQLGALEECASILCHRAESLIREGDPGAAAAAVTQAEQLVRRTGRPDETWAQFQVSFAEVARLRGELDEATRLIRRASHAADAGTLDVPWIAARIHTELGRLAELRSATAEAERQHAAAVELAAAAPFASELAHAAEGAAGAAVIGGDPERAARLLGAAAALRGLAVRGDLDVARISAVATEELGPEAFGEVFAGAAELDPDRARSVVLTHDQVPSSRRS